MEISSSNRRSFNRTWKRLGPLLKLIVASTSTTTTTLSLSSSNENRKLYSIADVGCDHGILSMSLACMAHVSSSQQQRPQEQQLPHNNDSIIDGTVNDNSNNNNNDNFFFNRVYGIDLSSKALDDGALQTLKKIINAITWSSSSIAEYYYINSKSNNNENNNNSNNTELLPIEFRISNGLEALHIGEADAIVLAGMGVETMMEILFLDNDKRRRSGKDTVITPPVDRVRTNRIYLQPANSRPQHMMKLYDRIQQTGEWILGNESIAYSSGRWYINSFFERRRRRRRRRQQLQQQSQQSNNDDGDDDDNDDDNDDVGGDSRFRFPGHFLVQQVTMNDNENVYESYMKHHLQWLNDDYERTPKYVIGDEDRRWIEYITPIMEETNIVGTISQR